METCMCKGRGRNAFGFLADPELKIGSQAFGAGGEGGSPFQDKIQMFWTMRFLSYLTIGCCLKHLEGTSLEKAAIK